MSQTTANGKFRSKSSKSKPKPFFIRRQLPALEYDRSDGQKMLNVLVVTIIGLGFIGGGTAMIAYSNTNNHSEDFLIIGACLIVFGSLFLAMAFVFVTKPLYERRKVKAIVAEKKRQEASLGVDKYVDSGKLSVVVADGAKQRHPSAVELYYSEASAMKTVHVAPSSIGSTSERETFTFGAVLRSSSPNGEGRGERRRPEYIVIVSAQFVVTSNRALLSTERS